jgi:branched-chain amino acid transport system substrate-binding protein
VHPFFSLSAKSREEIAMPRSISLNRRHLLAAAAAGATSLAAPGIVRAQAGNSGPLKVGVLLPRSGFEAGIGQDCQRGVDVAPAILKSLELPPS